MSFSFFNQALDRAYIAFEKGDVPVGCVIVKNNLVIARGENRVRATHSVTAHAEIVALQEASYLLKTQHLTDCDLYVTLEPCPMCAAAISLARIRTVYFGAYDVKAGGIIHGPRVYDRMLHKPDVIGGIQENACRDLLQNFFKDLRI